MIRVKDFHVSVNVNGQEEHFKININKRMGDNFRAALCPCWLNNSSWKIKTELGNVYDRGVFLSYDFNQHKNVEHSSTCVHLICNGKEPTL